MNRAPLLELTSADRLVEQYASKVRLARATELAHSERFLEAQALLSSNGGPRNVSEIDLLARIAARQGHFTQARRLWKMAIQLEPENQAYQECLEALTPITQIARIIAAPSDRLLNYLVWATVVFALATLLFLIFK